jgi:GNAT superfamily N-acetyltransferase
MELELRPADPAEAAELVAFVNASYASELPLTEASVKSEKIEFFWAVEKVSGKRVGVTGYMAKTPYLAETVKTVIAPEHRGQGLGERLSQLIEDEVRRSGFTKAMTTIYVTNLPMIFIKLKQGYLFEGFHPHHEKPGLHEYSLGKILKNP